jgi:hypothetical protein
MSGSARSSSPARRLAQSRHELPPSLATLDELVEPAARHRELAAKAAATRQQLVDAARALVEAERADEERRVREREERLDHVPGSGPKTKLATVKLLNVGIFRLTPEAAPPRTDALARVVASLYCEHMELERSEA